MKRVVFLMTALLLICALMCPALADVIPDGRLYDRYYDEIQLLDYIYAQDVCARLDEVSERHGVDVAVAVVQSLEGMSIEERTDDFYDYNGYGTGSSGDGIMLMLAWDEGEWCIDACGCGEQAFTQDGREYMGEQIMPYLYDGDFYSAFVVYAQLCDDLLTRAEQGNPYDSRDIAVEARKGAAPILRCLLIGAAIAMVVVLIMRGSMKSVQRQSGAANYAVNGSMAITHESDRFLYRKTQVHRRDSGTARSGGGTRSSSHVSSSGRSHSTTSGKFR